jgi:hypothetical protein
MSNELLTLLANLALSLSFIVALVFGIVQINAAARDRRERLSLESLRNFQTRDFAELMQFIINHKIPSTREELISLPVREQVIFLQFSQEMETLGILVAEKYIRIDLVDKILGSFVSSSWAQYKTMVMNLRQTDPYMSEYFQWLAESIERRMQEHPRKPFYETKALIK